jgi:ABC-type sugar transport system substrate-binding protein
MTRKLWAVKAPHGFVATFAAYSAEEAIDCYRHSLMWRPSDATKQWSAVEGVCMSVPDDDHRFFRSVAEAAKAMANEQWEWCEVSGEMLLTPDGGEFWHQWDEKHIRAEICRAVGW